MTTQRRRRYSCEELHLLRADELSNSCCEICQCDCLSSHRSAESMQETIEILSGTLDDNNNNNKNSNNNRNKSNRKAADKRKSTGTTNKSNAVSKERVKKKRNNILQTQERRTRSKSPCTERKGKSNVKLKRSKSAGCLLGNSHHNPCKPNFTRDCELLQDLLTPFETSRLEITGHRRLETAQTMHRSFSKSTLDLPTTSTRAAAMDHHKSMTSWSTPKICESLANLCLAPDIREAYQQVPMHDKKILNRMANKRSEKLMAKENAWLARKFWENERYERELFKCEQMEEYKRAVRDKQFQDYVLTKERLNELAQRDYEELQRLRQSLDYKDALTKRRLEAIRTERDITLCQRRCEELKKCEAVNLHQEEQHLGDVLRKQEICNRLSQRLRRANEIRNQMLDGYLKRLRYDNYVEQLMHEQHWRETQEMESMKRAQLKEHIDAKSKGIQKFIEQRQRRMEAMTKNAKISASLRELVRNSVTPEATTLAGGMSFATSTANLGKLLFDGPISRNSNKC